MNNPAGIKIRKNGKNTVYYPSVEEYVVSVRRYKIDGSYDKTIDCFSKDPFLAKVDFEIWTEQHSPSELRKHLQTTPCNIMVRKNGKLISYKDL